MRIMYMGTPEISAICLKSLVDGGHNIAAVVTREDKPRGRGNTLMPTPTKALACELGIEVYTPSTLRDDAFMKLLRKVDPELIVVVAFGKILPKSVLDYPKYGCINLHVSLLPKYRGAAPMQRAVMSGDSVTGVSVMYMDEGLDTGDIISSLSFPIGECDDFEYVHDTSARLGGELLSKTVYDIEAGVAKRTPQDSSLATYAAKIEKRDCQVDFTKPASAVSAQIRGVTPIPGAFSYLNGKMLKLFGVRAVAGKGKCGEVIALDAKGAGKITVACGEGAIEISGVIPEGKGRMSTGDFIRGRKIQIGDILYGVDILS